MTTATSELQALTAQFRAWDANDPEAWARSQLEEGIDQYGRLVFLRGAWEGVVAERDHGWMDSALARAKRRPDEPGAEAGLALGRLLAAGVRRDDLAAVVRVMQAETLAHVMGLLDDPGVVTYPAGDVPRVDWALVRLDEDGSPRDPIDGLVESVLETDPAHQAPR